MFLVNAFGEEFWKELQSLNTKACGKGREIQDARAQSFGWMYVYIYIYLYIYMYHFISGRSQFFLPDGMIPIGNPTSLAGKICLSWVDVRAMLTLEISGSVGSDY